MFPIGQSFVFIEPYIPRICATSPLEAHRYISHAAVDQLDLACSSMAYYLVLETDGLMRLRDTTHEWETEKRQQRGFPIRCADHNMKLALTVITVRSVSPSESRASGMEFFPPYHAPAE